MGETFRFRADEGVPDDVVADVAARARAAVRDGAPVVAVDGPSGAGKTTLAGRLAAALGAVPVVHVEDLYPGWDGLDAVVPRLVAGVLAPLAAGRDGRFRRWDWAAGADGEPVTVPAGPLLVVEGAGAAARAAAPYLAFVVWLDGPPAWRRERALARDGDTYAPHWERWAAQERVHFAREGTRGRADVVLEAVNSVGDTPPGR
jgi:hypothetical protein